MGPSLKKIILFILLELQVLVSVSALAPVWLMLDLPSTVSNNKICLPAGKGHSDCNDTPQRLHSLLNREKSTRYHQDRKKEKEQQQRFLKENQGQATGKEQPVNTKKPDYYWHFGYKKIITPGNIDLKDDTQILEIYIHYRIFLDEDTTSYIQQDVYIKTSLYATYESCTIIYDKQDQQGKAAFNEHNPHMTQQQEPMARSPVGPQTKTGQGKDRAWTDYEMLSFVGLSVSVLCIGFMLFKTRLEVWTIVIGKFGLCDGCHEARTIVRLVSCRPYKHYLCDSCLERLHECPECKTSIRAFM